MIDTTWTLEILQNVGNAEHPSPLVHWNRAESNLGLQRRVVGLLTVRGSTRPFP